MGLAGVKLMRDGRSVVCTTVGSEGAMVTFCLASNGRRHAHIVPFSIIGKKTRVTDVWAARWKVDSPLGGRDYEYDICARGLK